MAGPAAPRFPAGCLTLLVTGDREPALEKMLGVCGELRLLFCVLEYCRELRGRARKTPQ